LKQALSRMSAPTRTTNGTCPGIMAKHAEPTFQCVQGRRCRRSSWRGSRKRRPSRRCCR